MCDEAATARQRYRIIKPSFPAAVSHWVGAIWAAAQCSVSPLPSARLAIHASYSGVPPRYRTIRSRQPATQLNINSVPACWAATWES